MSDCIICHETMMDDHCITHRTPCNHTFCSRCFDKWCMNRLLAQELVTCPVCRTTVPASIFVRHVSEFARRGLRPPPESFTIVCMTRLVTIANVVARQRLKVTE